MRAHYSCASMLTLFATGMLCTAATQAVAKSTYRMPPDAIASLIDAPVTPGTSLSPDKETMLLIERPALPSIEEVSQPELRLAGTRISPRTNGRSRRYYSTGLSFKSVATGAERAISGLPTKPRISSVSWSPDGRTIAFINTVHDGNELWIVDAASAKAKRLTTAKLNATYGAPVTWISDSKTLLVKLIPDGRGPQPQEPTVPAGPIVEENIGKKRPARTYQDLLKSPHDEALFDHFFTSQLATVTLSGTVAKIGEPGVIATADPSPDGNYILTETLHKPYSYRVPASRFPVAIDIIDRKGALVRRIADKPLAEDVPVSFGSTRVGPRSVNWRADTPATVYWVEAQDDGDARKEAEVRDTVFMLDQPFWGNPIAAVNLKLRYGGIQWGHANLALVSEWWWTSRKTRTWMIDPARPGSEPNLLVERSFEDRYSDPGDPIMTRTPLGTYVMLLSDGGESVFLSGSGASPEGDRPFLDKMSFVTKKTDRLWRSEAPHYEYAVDLLDPDAMTVLTRRESKTEPPNYYIRNLKSGSDRAVTSFPHPAPKLREVSKELIHYERADGVKLTGTLYLPPGYKESDGPLPMLMWAYPQEYKSADAAGQVNDSPHRFVRTHSHSPLLWLMHGYAVLDDPTLPIIGEGEEEPNDTFIKQLVDGAQAAVDEVVRRGVADPDRIAIGGHSYGAFMTANLLSHSDLFRAGIARSGAYNRTLTPFSFQSEERTFWEAPHVYFTMSPFMHADKMDEPLLMIHGQADNNSGTYPMQSERYYNALKGLGATCKLVMLPHESHGYRARESVMHMAHEMTDWLDKFVKNVDPRETVDPKGTPGDKAS